MIFGRKKRGMIDVRELARRGKIRKDSSELPKFDTNKDGFVDFSKTSSVEAKPKSSGVTGGTMGFMDMTTNSSEFSTEKDGYSKKEVDEMIQKLDNMIYKMEQKIELLERKAGIGGSSGSSTGSSGSSSGSVMGAMGW